MEAKIDIDDWLTDEDKKQICVDEFRKSLDLHKEKGLERILSNAGYNIVFKEVDKYIDGSAEELIKERVIKSLSELDSFYIFKKKNAWDREESVGQSILYKSIIDNKELIEQRVKEVISDIDMQNIKEELMELFKEILYDKFFTGEQHAP